MFELLETTYAYASKHGLCYGSLSAQQTPFDRFILLPHDFYTFASRSQRAESTD
jgi:hypothetical protein